MSFIPLSTSSGPESHPSATAVRVDKQRGEKETPLGP